MRRLTRPALVAPVGGFAALVCHRLLAARVDQLAASVHPDYAAQLRRALAALEQAASQWLEWRREAAEVEAEAAADARAAALAAASRAPSAEVDTAAAARVLGRSANRVRQLCRSGRLPARRAGRVWLVDAGALAAHVEGRDGRL